VGVLDVELSKAEYWTSAGMCHFRSLEFDVEASAERFEDALASFVSALMGFARRLSALQGSLYSREEDMLATLMPRLAEVAQRVVLEDLATAPSKCGWWVEQDRSCMPRGAFLHGCMVQALAA
jgi:hypothetical protein